VKYLSILKDSLREALDSKVLYVTFGLSAILLFVLASTSFRQVTVKDEVEWICTLFNFSHDMEARAQPGSTALHWDVTSFEQLDQATEPWRGQYRFTLTLTVPPGKETDANQKADVVEGVTTLELWRMKAKALKREKGEGGREIQLNFITTGSYVDRPDDWPYEPAVLFGAFPIPLFRAPLTYSVYWVENILVNTIGAWIIVLLGVIVTASFVPNMLRKGTVDLILAKPVTRPGLLFFKYLGGLTFLFLNAAVVIGGVWLILGLRTGIWTWSFPVTVLILTFFFAVLYVVSTLFAILTRSTIVCILMSLLVWGVLFGIGLAYDLYHPGQGPGPLVQFGGEMQPKSRRPDPSPAAESSGVAHTIDFLHAILPRTRDLGAISTQLISQELLSEAERRQRGFEMARKVSWMESIGVSAAFIALMLGLSCWLFSRKDY
jgi:hypothetical protein